MSELDLAPGRLFHLEPIDALDPIITVTGDEEPIFDATVHALGCSQEWCRAWGDQPCRTRGGNDARQWHRGRG